MGASPAEENAFPQDKVKELGRKLAHVYEHRAQKPRYTLDKTSEKFLKEERYKWCRDYDLFTNDQHPRLLRTLIHTAEGFDIDHAFYDVDEGYFIVGAGVRGLHRDFHYLTCPRCRKRFRLRHQKRIPLEFSVKKMEFMWVDTSATTTSVSYPSSSEVYCQVKHTHYVASVDCSECMNAINRVLEE